MGVPPKPYYELGRIQALVDLDMFIVTKSASWSAFALGFDTDDIKRCIRGLTPQMLYKSMESTQQPGMWQDVYRTELDNKAIYLKLQVQPGDGWAVVVSFKER